MMPKGRKKKLLAQDILDGTHPERYVNTLELLGIPNLGEPFIPEHLMDDARGCIECIKQSMPPKLYSALDSYILAAFGVAWALHKLAVIKISDPDFPWIVKGRGGGMSVNTWVALLNKQAEMMMALGSRLGLDPHSRQQMKLPLSRQPVSKFAGLTDPRRSFDISNVSPSPAESGRVSPSS